MNRLTIRIRITVGTLLLATIFFAGAAFAIDRAVRSILESSATTVLTSDAAPYEAAIEQTPSGTIDPPAEGQLVALIDPAGSTRVTNLSAPLTTALPSPTTTPTVHTVVTPQKEYLVRVEKVETTGGSWVIYTARSDSAADLIRDGLRTGLIAGLSILALVFGAASWLLTGAALRPVGRLRRAADTLANSDGRGSLPVGDARDEVHDLAVTLNSLIDRLHDAAERERQMVSDASHELRTPLAILQSQLELVRTGDRSNLDTDLEAAQRAVARLARLSSELLELSGIEATANIGVCGFGELGEQLAEAVDRARFAARASGITIDYTVEGQPDADPNGRTVRVSSHDFGRIVDNLVENAVRAVGRVGVGVRSQSGPGAVDIRLSSTPAEAVLVVTDTGPGMPEEFIARAFDRFTRASEARETDGGSGLGLSIVHALVHRSDGTISLKNADDAGLIATVTLPLHNSQPAAS